jgi:hypothetical protein
VESSTKARAGEFLEEVRDFDRLVIVYGPCVISKIRFTRDWLANSAIVSRRDSRARSGEKWIATMMCIWLTLK